MKRFVSVMLALLLVLSSVSGFAADGQRMTTERLLGNILAGLAGIFESPEFAFEYAQGGERLSGGLLQDAEGLPVVTGGLESKDQSYGACISSEGVVVQTPMGEQGMRWDAIAELLLQEMGLEGLMAISPEDGQILASVFEDVVGGISRQAVSSVVRSATLGGESAQNQEITVNVDRLLSDLNASVPRALMKNRVKLDDMLKCWSPLLQSMFPEMSGDVNATQLISLWRNLGLSRISTGGMIARMNIVTTGSILDPWKLTLTVANARFEAWLDENGFQFILDTGMGQILTFDSRDAAYLWELAMSLPGYITEEALSYRDEIYNGLRRITFDLDDVRLQKQLVSGIMQIVAANRDRIDSLLNKYRPWLELFATGADDITADTLLMALTVMNMNARYYGLSGYFGIVYENSGIHLEISYPVYEIACPAETVAPPEMPTAETVTSGVVSRTSVYTYTEETRSEQPVLVSGNIGSWEFYFRMDDTSIDVRSENPYGWNYYLFGGVDRAGDSLSLTFSRNYSYQARFSQSITLSADAESLHFYTGDGSVDIRIDIHESDAAICAAIGGDVITGTFTWSEDLWKLTLTDGEEIVEAALRIGDSSLLLNVSAAGAVLTAGVSWGNNRWTLDISTPVSSLGGSVEAYPDGLGVEWNYEQGAFGMSNAGEFCVRGQTVKLALNRFAARNAPGNLNLEVEACWASEDIRLDVYMDRNRMNTSADDFALTYRPGQLMLLSGGQMIHVSDVTPEGSTDKNIAQIAVYDAYAYTSGNTAESTVELDACCTRYELVTQAAEDCYYLTLTHDGAELCSLVLDFDPEAAQPVAEDVLWMTPELFRLMFGLASIEAEEAEMPIQVYAEEEPAVQVEAIEVKISKAVPESTERSAVSMELPIDRNVTPEIISELQMRLYSFGLLSTDGLEAGVLDQKTLQAVADFQNAVNERYGAALAVIDPTSPDPVIDVETIRWLFEREF